VVTMQASEHASLLEVLSERLLTDFTEQLWRKVFLGPGYERIRFERETVTFLCTDTLDFEWTPGEIETLAARHQGRLERCDHRLVLVFPRARGALEIAMLLQRTASCSLRMALLTATCTTAVFHQDGKPRRLAIGTEVRQACHWADRCAPGAIHISADTYRALGPSQEWQPQAARVSTEKHGEEVTSAAMTLSAAARSDAGTFAGFGFA
jgi:class 3 adenylate cyclase